jgi:hypothetical protein
MSAQVRLPALSRIRLALFHAFFVLLHSLLLLLIDFPGLFGIFLSVPLLPEVCVRCLASICPCLVRHP